MELDESQCLCVATGNFVCVLVCYALLGENVLPDLSLLLPLLERLFGVKGHDCCLSCLTFRNECRRVLLVDLFFEGRLRHVLCVVYNFGRRRLFCTGSGLMLPSFPM